MLPRLQRNAVTLSLAAEPEDSVPMGKKLDEWFGANRAAFASHDRAAQGRALLSGIELVKELDRLKADGLGAIQSLLSEQNALSADQRAASLIRGFEFGARLADTLHDELLDTTGETKVWRLLDGIVLALDKIGPGLDLRLQQLREAPHLAAEFPIRIFGIDIPL
jgi:hypothetical protein